MAAKLVVAAVFVLAALAVWRNLRRGKGEYCSLCSCGACKARGTSGCHCHDGR